VGSGDSQGSGLIRCSSVHLDRRRDAKKLTSPVAEDVEIKVYYTRSMVRLLPWGDNEYQQRLDLFFPARPNSRR
jgi:hypothetical protein